MAGVNPYIAKVPVGKATQPFRVTFIDEETGEKTETAVDPATFPFGQIGQEGSLLDIATEAGVAINHACGGVCACSTCHVYIQKGLESCSKSTEDEEDELDKAGGGRASLKRGQEAGDRRQAGDRPGNSLSPDSFSPSSLSLSQRIGNPTGISHH
jgi:2Fe-2S ferredoxin